MVKQALTFSEAVAIFVPWLLKVMAAKGLSWAGIIVTARWNVQIIIMHKTNSLVKNIHNCELSRLAKNMYILFIINPYPAGTESDQSLPPV